MEKTLVVVRESAARPFSFRIPSSGRSDPHFDLTRKHYLEVERQGFWQLIRLKQPWMRRGLVLVFYDEVMAFLRAHHPPSEREVLTMWHERQAKEVLGADK